MNALPPIFGSRESIGLGGGLLAAGTIPFRAYLLGEPAWLLLVIVLLAGLSGGAAASVSVRDGMEPAKAVRFGAWAAFLAAITGASLFALGSRLTEGWQPLLRAILAGSLSILPAAFCGMMAAGLAAITLSSAAPQAEEPKVSLPEPSVRALWMLRGVIGVLALSAVFLPPGTSSPATARASIPLRSLSKPPAFSFSPPAAMKHANAIQWRFARHREFRGVTDSSLVLSSDDRWAACVGRDPAVIHVIDLHSEFSMTLHLPHEARSFSFSPTAERLFVVSQTPSSVESGVMDIRNNRYIALPKPRKGTLPASAPLWWKEKEVLFAPNSDERLILNLDTLEIDDAQDVASWKSTDPLLRSKIVREITPGLRDRPQWQWEVRPFVASTELPEIERSNTWPIKLGQCLAMIHPARDSLMAFPQLPVKPGDSVFSSRDGSKVLHFSDGALHQYCFDARPVPPLRWNVFMPHGPEAGPDADEVVRALRDGTLAALVYPPMINPLNQAVVGPARGQAKAIVRFSKWESHKATVYLWQGYHDIGKGDILADACSLLEDLRGTLFNLKTPHRWWTPLTDAPPGSDDIAALPDREEKKRQQAAADELERAARKAKDEEEARQARAEQERAAAMKGSLFAAAMPAQPSAPVVAPAIDTQARLQAFVEAHHQKAERSDVTGMVSDYAPRVDHFRNGVVDRDWILQDELKYHANHQVIEEKVLGNVAFARAVGQHAYEATYLLRVMTREKATGKQGGGLFQVTLLLQEEPEGFRIVLQRSEKKQ